MRYLCPVCGYQMDDPPQDYNICPSCGTEFGYHDSGRTHEELRRIWLHSGAQWWSPVDKKPEGWNPYEQLKTAFALEPMSFSSSSGMSPSNVIRMVPENFGQGDWTLNLTYQVRAAETD